MKNQPNFKLLIIGLIFNSAVLIFKNYFSIPDFVAGGLFGIGISLMILSFILNKKRNVRL